MKKIVFIFLSCASFVSIAVADKSVTYRSFYSSGEVVCAKNKGYLLKTGTSKIVNLPDIWRGAFTTTYKEGELVITNDITDAAFKLTPEQIKKYNKEEYGGGKASFTSALAKRIRGPQCDDKNRKIVQDFLNNLDQNALAELKKKADGYRAEDVYVYKKSPWAVPAGSFNRKKSKRVHTTN